MPTVRSTQHGWFRHRRTGLYTVSGPIKIPVQHSVFWKNAACSLASIAWTLSRKDVHEVPPFGRLRATMSVGQILFLRCCHDLVRIVVAEQVVLRHFVSTRVGHLVFYLILRTRR